MDNKPKWLNDYAHIIDSVRNRLICIRVVEEITLQYAIIRLFSRSILSMCEIYTLMDNGYPEGAFALSRQVFETIVLMDYLIKHKSDRELIERFFDDIEITKIKIQIEREKYASKNEMIHANDALEKYKEAYSDYWDTNKGFGDYWWVKKGCTFAALAKETNFPKDYMYKEISSVVHMSAFNSMIYIGNTQDRILIGETYDGTEYVGWYSMLCFCMAMDLFGKEYGMELVDLITQGRELVERMRCEFTVQNK